VVEEAGKPRGGAFFDEIAEVHLAYTPTRVARNRYRARIVYRGGGMAELTNTHYAGVADFPEHNAEYVAFLTELHRRLAAKGKDVRYRRGSGIGGYIANWLLTVFVFAMIALAFVLLIAWGLVWIAVVKLAIILFFIPTLIRFMLQSKPGAYEPLAIPKDVLPRM
jgi:Flp pilus assembly protein TadB